MDVRAPRAGRGIVEAVGFGRYTPPRRQYHAQIPQESRVSLKKRIGGPPAKSPRCGASITRTRSPHGLDPLNDGVFGVGTYRAHLRRRYHAPRVLRYQSRPRIRPLGSGSRSQTARRSVRRSPPGTAWVSRLHRSKWAVSNALNPVPWRARCTISPGAGRGGPRPQSDGSDRPPPWRGLRRLPGLLALGDEAPAQDSRRRSRLTSSRECTRTWASAGQGRPPPGFPGDFALPTPKPWIVFSLPAWACWRSPPRRSRSRRPIQRRAPPPQPKPESQTPKPSPAPPPPAPAATPPPPAAPPPAAPRRPSRRRLRRLHPCTRLRSHLNLRGRRCNVKRERSP